MRQAASKEVRPDLDLLEGNGRADPVWPVRQYLPQIAPSKCRGRRSTGRIEGRGMHMHIRIDRGQLRQGNDASIAELAVVRIKPMVTTPDSNVRAKLFVIEKIRNN